MGLRSAAVVSALAVSCATSSVGPASRRAIEPQDHAWVSAPREGRRSTPAAPPRDEKPIEPLPLDGCGNTDDGFAGWLESFRRHAVVQGISSTTVAAALSDVAYDPGVIELDRTQAGSKPTFAAFSAKRVTRARTARGKELLRTHATLLSKIEERFGVAPEVIVAIWGLETDFGQNTGSTPCMRALATLAYDCRRPKRFRDELLSALRIVQRGDLSPAEMVGAWAGELGQTQFLPSSYERFAVDFDGDGKADVIRSTADALASTASYLRGHGWQPRVDYRPGAPNFTVLGEWNASEVYRRTIALFASKLAQR